MTEPKKKLGLPATTGDKPVREPKRPPVRSTSTATPRIKARPATPEGDAPKPARRSTEGRPARSDEDRPPRRDDGDAPRRPAPRFESDRGNSERPQRAPRADYARRDDTRREDTASDAPYERRSRGADGVNRGPARGSERPAFKPRMQKSEPRDADGAVRLSKRMTELGLCSRREADEYIERGWVKVDGKVVDELGSKILPNQKIELNRQAEDTQQKRVTVILNKPIGYVSGQAEDDYEPAAVLITNENHWSEDPIKRPFDPRLMRKLAPAGRLDIDSTGMLVLTQDGRIAKHLIGEDSDIEKEYLVRVEGPLSYDDLALLNHGLMLDGVELQPAKVSWQNEHQLRFVLREGRKRQIRRMCELVGLRVTALKRIRIGSINLAKLPPGQWRYLGDHEKF
ncbi:MAG: pseudouridine synthase [Rhodocyclaceae bacterium]